MFDTEQQLVDQVTCQLKSSSPERIPVALNCKNQVILHEVNLGYGIADIVLTQCVEFPERRNKYLNLLEIKILKIINENSGVTVESIIEKTRLTRRKIISAIHSLENLRLVKSGKDTISPLKKYAGTVKKTIAIEAKLHNWQRALKQAYRYKWFSHKSFVCLPSNRVNPARKNIEKFKEMGVGLIGFCEDKGFQVFHSPRTEKPISDEMTIMLNERVLSALHAS